MKKSKFTASQIMEALERTESGIAVPETRRELGISTATFYNRQVRRDECVVDGAIKELEAERTRLRKMFVEEKIKAGIVAEALEKRTEAIYTPRDGRRRNSTQGRTDPASMRGIWHKPDALPLRAASQ